jgi:YHS domain-containing protein
MTTRRAVLGLIAALPAVTLTMRAAQAAEPSVYSDGGAAISGTDPVAYFTQSGPVKGSPDFSSAHDGATWHFASAANKALFDADPAKYAPQYGGYCAYAVSQGYTASTDPDAWTIEDGKLYLNFSQSVRRRWLRDVPGHIAAGDANWPSVLGG